jgi:hypothetical protein
MVAVARCRPLSVTGPVWVKGKAGDPDVGPRGAVDGVEIDIDAHGMG